MALAFISYSRRDKEFVETLYNAFLEAGYKKDDLWVDWQDIPPTADWWSEIRSGIDNSDNFLFVVSPDSAMSKVCRDEIEHAVQTNKRVVPVVWRDVTGEAYDQLHPAISAHNWIFAQELMTNTQAIVQKLDEALNQDLEYIREHTRLLVRAREWEDRNRSNGYLLSGEEITEAESWMTRGYAKEPHVTELHSEFIHESRKRATTIQRRFVTAAGLAAVVMAVLAVVAVFQWREADAQRRIAQIEAEESRSLALSANAQLAFNDNNFPLAISIANEATNTELTAPPRQTIFTLDEAAHMPGARAEFTAHGDTVSAIAIHPDGGLALSSDGERILAWDYNTLETQYTLDDFAAAINTLALSVDGGTGYAALANGDVITWDTASGELSNVFSAPQPDEYNATELVISDDGESLFVAYERTFIEDGDGAIAHLVRHLDAASGEEVTVIDAYPAAITDVAEHNGLLAIVGDRYERQTCAADAEDCIEPQYSAVIWNEADQEIFLELNPRDDANSVSLSPAGDRAFIGLDNGQLSWWDLTEGTELETWSAHAGFVNVVEVIEDGDWLISGDENNLIIIWEIAGIEGLPQKLYEFVGHTGPIRSIAVSPDGKVALSGSSDQTVRVLELGNGEEIWHMTGHDSFSLCGEITADASVAFTCEPGTIFVWDVETGEQIFAYDRHSYVGNVVAVPNSTQAVSGAFFGEVFVWDYETGETLHQLTHPGDSVFVSHVAVTSDGTRAVTLGDEENDSLALWDLESGELLTFWRLTEEFDVEKVSAMGISRDDQLAAVSTFDGVIAIINLAAEDDVQVWESTQNGAGVQIRSINFNHDGTQIVTAKSDSTIGIWDVQSQAEVRELIGHTLLVNYAMFSRDGAYVISGSDDTTLRLWDAATGDELRRIRLLRKPINIGFVSPDLPLVVGAEGPTQFLLQLGLMSVEDLQNWVVENRLTEPLSCTLRAQYAIDTSDCE